MIPREAMQQQSHTPQTLGPSPKLGVNHRDGLEPVLKHAGPMASKYRLHTSMLYIGPTSMGWPRRLKVLRF
jgi:hypothetical protein